MLDFSKLGTGNDGKRGSEILEPRKIFTTLVRQPRFRRPSDEQGEVLDKWFSNRTRPDNTLKMNTGSGKTLVGLLTLQSSINEGITPAVYITPDNYLASQALQEAQELGITATLDVNDTSFLTGKAILIINIYKLINGKSVFGVGAEGVKIPIKALVIDDAHACLATVADQFRMRIPAGHSVYKSLLQLFSTDLENQSSVGMLDLRENDPEAVMPVPYWAWKDKQDVVIRELHAHRADDELKFVWPLLKDILPLCQCVFGGNELEIASRCLPIDVIPSFVQAKRRIYMTATLADDGVLISHFQADPDAVADPIKPRGVGDIGDRMILAPQEINPDTTLDDIKELIVDIANTYNVTVIVPSAKRADYWRGVAGQILDSSNINQGVKQLKDGKHIGITVLINKYDGVDLPEDACRLLVIDGLPEVYGLIERSEMNLIEGTELQKLRLVQKLEQGMGRGVRSSEDYCAVLLIGARLTHRIHTPGARAKFTSATLAQLDLSRDVTAQVRGKPVAELRPILDYCLQKDSNWWQAGRKQLATAPEGQQSFIDSTVKHLRRAFDLARVHRFDKARDEVQEAVNQAQEPALRGYLKQQLAEYVHHLDPVHSQEILLSAVQDNRRVLKPIRGINYAKLHAPANSQASAAANYMKRFSTPNEAILFANALIDDLMWGEDRTNAFEAAVRELGMLLGFSSQRPEQETGKGPDNLWALGGLAFLVIECKSGATGGVIGKNDCNQLIGSMEWFKQLYDRSCSATPIMIHPRNKFDRYSSPTSDIRIIETKCLENLRNQLKAYVATIAASGSLSNEATIMRQLNFYRLTAQTFVETFSTGFTTTR